MIYTVTCNPSIDYFVSVDDFQMGMTNRTSDELILPGGKGINVSTVLSELGVENTALGFVAGFTGNEILKMVEERGIRAKFICLDEGISRMNVKLLSVDGTEINGQGPFIGEEKTNLLMEQLDELNKEDTLVLAGSIPPSMPDDLYRKIMERLSGKGVKIVVDATRDLLLNVLECHPFLVKPNHHELGEIFGVKIKGHEDAAFYGKKLQDMGAQNVLVSMGKDGAVLAAADGQVLMAQAPAGQVVNSVGAGDSMVAGFLAGWEKTGDYKEAFLLGLAAGSASAFSRDLAKGEDIQAVRKEE